MASCARCTRCRPRDGDCDDHCHHAEVGHEIRLLLLPGIKRKTYRREELQSIVDAADGSRA